MTEPTVENISEAARSRRKAIYAKGGSVEGVIAKAVRFATRPHHPATTAQEAVNWAILDLGVYDDGGVRA